jgi:23S rRNA pseudouridine1911/1915/1917 synthase
MDDLPELLVTETDAGQRLDRFLAQHAALGGRAQVKAWLESGRVTVDGRLMKKGDRVQAGQRVRVEPLAPLDASPRDASQGDAAALDVRVVFEDAHLLVVDKPAGLPTQGIESDLRGDDPHTLTARLLTRFPDLRGVGYRESEPGILHRLDNDTSGLLIVARTTDSFERLRLALKGGQIDKRYIALCAGTMTAPCVFEGFLVSDRRARVGVSQVAVARSRAARTEVIDAHSIASYSLLTLRVPHAGRHQIRAQLAAAGHPLVGDTLYGGPTIEGLNRHFLHASELRLAHPMTGDALELVAPLPIELDTCLRDRASSVTTV